MRTHGAVWRILLRTLFSCSPPGWAGTASTKIASNVFLPSRGPRLERAPHCGPSRTIRSLSPPYSPTLYPFYASQLSACGTSRWLPWAEPGEPPSPQRVVELSPRPRPPACSGSNLLCSGSERDKVPAFRSSSRGYLAYPWSAGPHGLFSSGQCFLSF